MIISKDVYVDKYINHIMSNINSSSGWCAIHLGCGGQLQALSINKDEDFICSICEEKLTKNVLLFETENEHKLPSDITPIDILQMNREDRAKLINPKTDSENKKQHEMIRDNLNDKPLFF